MRRAGRLLRLVAAVAIIVIGVGVVVGATEVWGSKGAGPAALRLEDVRRALEQAGFAVAPGEHSVQRPSIPVMGSALQADGTTIEVYLFASVERRVAVEQRLANRLRQLNSDASPVPYVSSARNVLLVLTTNDPVVTRVIHQVAASPSRPNA